MATLYPTYDIGHLTSAGLNDSFVIADNFKNYLNYNPHMNSMHKHNFYHLLYFTEGSGTHTIDFKNYPVQKGMIYFMYPGQIHNWRFENAADGYIVNFSANFFDHLGIHSSVLQQFSFFSQHNAPQVFTPQVPIQKEMKNLFEKIIAEYRLKGVLSHLAIASHLLSLFVLIQRNTENHNHNPDELTSQNSLYLLHFRQLLELHYQKLKLPKQYAELMHITPAKLNAVCNQLLGQSAGTVIRERVVLEAKRLLVNFDLSINEIALELDFADNSYFVKYFKKYTATTPEAFRQQHYQEKEQE